MSTHSHQLTFSIPCIHVCVWGGGGGGGVGMGVGRWEGVCVGGGRRGRCVHAVMSACVCAYMCSRVLGRCIRVIVHAGNVCACT